MYGYDSIDLAAIYESEGDYADESLSIDFDLYASLVPIPVDEWAPQNVGHVHPILLPSDGFPLEALFEIVGYQRFNRKNLLAFFHQGWIGQQKLSAKLLCDPVQIIHIGWELAKKAWQSHGRDSLEFASTLILVGTGTIRFSLSNQCELCFRQAHPGMRRCGEHTRAKILREIDDANGAKQSHRARTGRRAVKDYQERLRGQSSDEFIVPYPDAEIIAGILWNGTHRLGEQARILHALESSPLVRDLLPKSFGELAFDSQLEALRSVIDPNHWDVQKWSQTIRNAQVWFEEEQHAAPGGPPKGMREKNRRLAEKALSLLAAGNSQKEIAIQLDVSESNLSHLLRRYRKKI